MSFGRAQRERLTEMSSDWQAHIAAFPGCFSEWCGKSATSSAIEMQSSALILSLDKNFGYQVWALVVWRFTDVTEKSFSLCLSQ